MLRPIATIIAAAVVLSGAAVRAQEAQGYWIGTLAVSPGQSLRTGIAISVDESGEISGTLDSPDQGVFDVPLAEVFAEGGRLAFSVPSVQLQYESRWNPDASAWEGNFARAGQIWPLVLRAGERPARTQPASLPADWAIPQEPEVAAILEKRIAPRTGAGIVAGIFDDSGARTVARGPAGTAAFDADTLFEIGSITKVFTALLLADMVLAGEVALDDPVESYLPAGATVPRRGGKQITLRMLSLHNSGLPRLPDNMPYGEPRDPYADYTEALLLDFLAGYQLPRDPGEAFEYSNLGVGLLGYALARAGGSDFESLLRARILDPLAMTDTAITLSAEQQARLAQGHDEFMRPTPGWAMPTLAGAGALRSSANDMLAFVEAALDPQSPIAPHMALLLGERASNDGGPDRALGWMFHVTPTGPLLLYDGGTGGFVTHLSLQPSTGRGLVIFANSSAGPGVQDIGLHVIAGLPVLSTPPTPPAPPPAPERVAITLTGAQLDHLTGTYRIAPGIEAKVRREDAQLTVQITGQPALPVYPLAPLEFFWRAVDARIRFVEGERGIAGAVLFQNGREIPLERID